MSNPENPSRVQELAGRVDESGLPLWQRALYMILFGALANFLLFVFFVACLVQLVVFFIDRKANEELRKATRQLWTYLGDILGYLAFIKNERPFPFSPFPKAEPEAAPSTPPAP